MRAASRYFSRGLLNWPSRRTFCAARNVSEEAGNVVPHHRAEADLGIEPGNRSVLRSALLVGDLSGGQLSVKNSGGATDTTKTRASRRSLPVPKAVLPLLEQQAGDRPRSDWMFPSPRTAGQAIGKRYVSDAVTRAVARANQDRQEHVQRINVHGLRHTFAAIALSEAKADLLSVSRAMGHARPSITLDQYGHLAPAGLSPLMAKIDELVALR